MSIAGYIEFIDLATGNVYRAFNDNTVIENRLAALENKQSLSVTVVLFNNTNWVPQSTGEFQMEITGCNHILKVYKSESGQLVEVPCVSVKKLGEQSFRVVSLCAFEGQYLVS